MEGELARQVADASALDDGRALGPVPSNYPDASEICGDHQASKQDSSDWIELTGSDR
jgi:hypothetical protein